QGSRVPDHGSHDLRADGQGRRGAVSHDHRERWRDRRSRRLMALYLLEELLAVAEALSAAGSAPRHSSATRGCASCCRGRDIWAERVIYRYADREIVVVSREGLVTMKRLAGRTQDLADIARLEGNADDEEA